MSLSRVVNGIEQNTFELVLALEQESDIDIVKIREALEKEPNSFQSFQLVDGLRYTKKMFGEKIYYSTFQILSNQASSEQTMI